MLKNYLKTALRNIWKQKFYAGVNLLGLSFGVVCCLLIMLYVKDELSYDRFNANADRIYRVVADINFGGNQMNLSVAPAPMAGALVNDYPEVENAVRIRNMGSFLAKRENEIQNFKEDQAAFADPSFFDIFSIPLVQGDKATVLEQPNTLAISASMAEKYFPDEDPIGQALVLDNRDRYEVTAVYEDIPTNAHFQFDFLMAMEGWADSKSPIWLSNNYHSYILLNPSADAAALEAKLPGMFKKYAGPQVQQMLNMTLDEVEAGGQGVTYNLQALTDIHLKSNLSFELAPNGDIKYVYIFSMIALFILLIACINFMNLSTARAGGRAKEVGVRKVLGSMRKNLIRQFLVESVLVSLSAVAIAIILAEALVPIFNAWVGKEVSIPLGNPMFVAGLIGGAILLGMISGVYPAFYLSSFQPVKVLKGQLRSNLKSGWFRNALVVFQFAVSIFLIIGTIVINKQLNFIRNKKMGFDREQVITLHDAYALGDQTLTFKEKVTSLPEVKSATVSCFLPVESSRSDQVMWPEGPMTEENSVSMQFWRVDHDYLKTMGMELIAGRDFSIDMPTDSVGIIINERAADLFDFENPIGERINSMTGSPGKGGEFMTYTILGVIENFHYESLRENVDALGLVVQSCNGYMALRYQSGDPKLLIAKLQELWKELAPGQPFAYSFMDESFEAMYEAEQQTSQIFLVFAFLAILIACLGLFALATFTAERRTKEIGIRKVMGASAGNIFVLLSSEFAKWVLVANVIAIPLAIYFANSWLQDFTFQTRIGLGVFVLAALIALGIAVLTVSYQSIRAALANPIKSLRYE